MLKIELWVWIWVWMWFTDFPIPLFLLITIIFCLYSVFFHQKDKKAPKKTIKWHIELAIFSDPITPTSYHHFLPSLYSVYPLKRQKIDKMAQKTPH